MSTHETTAMIVENLPVDEITSDIGVWLPDEPPTLHTTEFLQLKLNNYLYQLRVGRVEAIEPFYATRRDAYLVTFTHAVQNGVLTALKAGLPRAQKHGDHHVYIEIPQAWWWSDSDQAQLEAKMHQEQEDTLRIWQGGGIADAALETLLNADPVVEGKRMIEAAHPLPSVIVIDALHALTPRQVKMLNFVYNRMAAGHFVQQYEMYVFFPTDASDSDARAAEFDDLCKYYYLTPIKGDVPLVEITAEGADRIGKPYPIGQPTRIVIAEPPKNDDDTDTDFIPVTTSDNSALTHVITPAQYRAEEFSAMQRRGWCMVRAQHNGERRQVEHITRDDESGEYGAHLKGVDAPVFPFNALLTVDWLHRDGNCDCISCLNAETQFADVDPIVVAPTSLIDNTLDHYQRRAETAEAILEDIRVALGIAKGDDVVEVARTAANLADAYQDAVKEIAALQNEHVRAMQLAGMVRSHRNAIKHVLSDQRLIGANTLQLALTRELARSAEVLS